MGLDFTSLDKKAQAAGKAEEPLPVPAPEEKQKSGSYQDWLNEQNALAAKIQEENEERKRIAALRKGKDDSTRKLLLSVAKETQKNLQRGGTLVYEVNKAIRDDKPPEQVALLAVKCVSLLISDPMMYTALEKKYEERYGITLSTKWPFKVREK